MTQLNALVTRPACSMIQRLLACGVPRSAELEWLVDRREPELADELLVSFLDVFRDLPVVHLGVDLPRNQFLVDELSCP